MQQNINLLSALPAAKVTVFPTNTIIKILGGWLLTLILVYVINLGIVKSKQTEFTTLEQTKKGLTTQIDTVKKDIDNIKEIKPTFEIAPLPIAQTSGFSQYLTEIAYSVPEGMWLEAISLFEPNDIIDLQGKALSPALIPKFLNVLSQVSSINVKRFSVLQLQKVENNNFIQFVLKTAEVASPPKNTNDNQNESNINKT